MLTKICPGCKAPSPINAAFCQNCGHRFRTSFAQHSAANQGSSSTSKAKTALLLWVWVALAALGLFVLAGYALGRQSHPQEAQHVELTPSQEVAPAGPFETPPERAARIARERAEQLPEPVREYMDENHVKTLTGPDGRVIYSEP